MAKSSPRCSSVKRTTTFPQLPDWLSRHDVKNFLGISLSAADGLIHRLPHRFFGKHLRISKTFLSPDTRVKKGAR
jgi:hypothetical protein